MQAEHPFPLAVIFVPRKHIKCKGDDSMPTAKKLPSGSWRCQVYSHTEEIVQEDGSIKKKRIYKSFTCDDPSPKGRRKAERMAADWAAEKEAHDNCSLTLGEAMSEYIEARSSILSPATIREYKHTRERDLQGLMGIRIDEITQEQIQREINREALSHSPKSVRNMHGLLSATMHSYRPNFTLSTALPKKVRPKLYIPSEEEIRRLLDYVKGSEMEIPVLLAAFGPMRRGEIAALDSDHVNGNIVHVEYALTMNEYHEWVRKAPKSASGNRYIEFPDFVAEKLAGKKGRIVLLKPHQITNRFRTILKKAGLPHFRFHDLRHYSASIQHALGIPDAYIMQRGGWGNDGVLKNVYRHALEDKNEQMNRIANGYFESLCNTECNTK